MAQESQARKPKNAGRKRGRRRPAGARDSKAAQAQEPADQWVTFRLGRELYALKALNVQEILKAGDVTDVPGSEDFVLGVINLRGNIVTVIDARTRFGLREPDSGSIQQVIVIEVNDQALGLMVDDVDEVTGIRASEIEPAPQFESDQVAKHILGVVRRDHGLIVLVDVRRLIPQSQAGE